VASTTLQRWVHAGLITPTSKTMGGHLRWDLDDLRRQIKNAQEATPVSEPASTPEKQPVVAAIVTSPRGVLAGRRNDGKPPWTFIAGEIEPGESQADAAVREVKEETGLLVIAGVREIGRRVHPKTGRTMIYLECAPTAGTDVFVGDEEELAEVRWLSLAEADELMPGMFEPVHEHLRRTLGQ
jgi:8-oxo-dGTP pyrophosphatase MutT (NUDIX family)